jgi:hypothetical protein
MRREPSDGYAQRVQWPRLGLPLVEIAFVLLIIGAGAGCLRVLLGQGYLPAPFFYASNDTFMDWFNTAYWAHSGDEYRIWHSIYPPLSFAVLKFATIQKCYVYDAFLARDCDWPSKVVIAFLFVSCAAAAFWCFRAKDRATAAVRTVALCLGFPMLFALERGNLCLAAFAGFALAWAQSIRGGRGGWLPMAAAISFKPYLAVALAAPLIERRWAFVERCIVAILGLWLAAFIVIGTGAPGQVVMNQFRWAGAGGRPFYEPLASASTYAPLLAYLAHAGAVTRALGAGWMGALMLLLTSVMRAGQLAAATVLAWAYVTRPATPAYRLAALALALLLTTADVGGYADVFLIFLVFLEKWDRPPLIAALVAAYLLCVPFDVSLLQVGNWPAFSYLGARMVDVPLALGLSALARPGLVLVIQGALSWAVFADIRRSRSERVDALAATAAT